jgi:hypothetical protein
LYTGGSIELVKKSDKLFLGWLPGREGDPFSMLGVVTRLSNSAG